MPVSNKVKSEAAALIAKNEDFKEHMYLDSKGKVTIGYGFEIPNEIALAKVMMTAKAAAKAFDKKAEWKKLHDLGKAGKAGNRKADAYAKETDGKVTKIEAERLLKGAIEDFARQLKLILPLVESFPDEAQIALLDIIYNVGPTKLRAQFLKMLAELKKAEPDWDIVARESHRTGISGGRNSDVKALFLKAKENAKKNKKKP